MNNIIAPASYHNVMVAEEIMEPLPHPYTLGISQTKLRGAMMDSLTQK